MKNHSEFAEDLRVNSGITDPQLILRILALSTKGVAPEAKGSATKNRLCDMIYNLDDAFFRSDTDGTIINGALAPIQPAPPRYKLGATSLAKLSGVKLELASCVEYAIQVTNQDFTVLEGARSVAAQRKAVDSGNSRTMQSKHIPDGTGVVRAVDLVPWIDGKANWDWNGCAEICIAMIQAAAKFSCLEHIRWGGSWDTVLADFVKHNHHQTRQAVMIEVESYKKRHAGADFIDGPHFEWVA